MNKERKFTSLMPIGWPSLLPVPASSESTELERGKTQRISHCRSTTERKRIIFGRREMQISTRLMLRNGCSDSPTKKASSSSKSSSLHSP